MLQVNLFLRSICSLRAGSLVWVGDKELRTGEKNEAAHLFG